MFGQFPFLEKSTNPATTSERPPHTEENTYQGPPESLLSINSKQETGLDYLHLREVSNEKPLSMKVEIEPDFGAEGNKHTNEDTYHGLPEENPNRGLGLKR